MITCNCYEKEITKNIQGFEETETVYAVLIMVYHSEVFCAPHEDVVLFYSLADAERFAENYVPPENYNYSSFGCYITIKDINVK